MVFGALEHVNFTVADSKKTAETLCLLFDWKIRWHGKAINGGYTYHVGNDTDYVAIYTPGEAPDEGDNNYVHKGGLNHIGILVDDLETAEKRILDAGYTTFNHMDYEPGRRFYFKDENDIEFEVVSYA